MCGILPGCRVNTCGAVETSRGIPGIGRWAFPRGALLWLMCAHPRAQVVKRVTGRGGVSLRCIWIGTAHLDRNGASG